MLNQSPVGSTKLVKIGQALPGRWARGRGGAAAEVTLTTFLERRVNNSNTLSGYLDIDNWLEKLSKH